MSGRRHTPSPIDRHTEEITLIAGITSPHVGWPHTRGEVGWGGIGGVHVEHDVQVCVRRVGGVEEEEIQKKICVCLLSLSTRNIKELRPLSCPAA